MKLSRPIYRVCMALLAVFAVALIGCVPGCQSVTAPPQSYVQAHRNTHDKAKRIYDGFKKANPSEANAAQNLYDSEEILIHNAEAGTFPAPAP